VKRAVQTTLDFYTETPQAYFYNKCGECHKAGECEKEKEPEEASSDG